MDGVLIIGVLTLLRLVIPFGLLLALGLIVEHQQSSKTDWR